MPKPIEDMSIEELQITYGVSRSKAKQIHKVYCKYPTDESDYQSEHGTDFFEMGDRVDIPIEGLTDETEEEWWLVI
jgi:hypothetical protein|tara:strand:+ start:241 stop:468 length:228 start_codon:yes stop_codon:yes gene_type:complete